MGKPIYKKDDDGNIIYFCIDGQQVPILLGYEKDEITTVNILGTEYEIIFGKEADYPNLKDNDGYIDTSSKKIIIDDMTTNDGDISRKEDIEYYKKQVLRHEIIHGFLFESGMDSNTHSPMNWAYSEEIVDWFAIQSPKIFKTFQELELI